MASRAELVEQMHLAGREISAAAVMFHGAVAARRGLSATEEKALDILMREGPLTHAELARHTGLAPASVSNLLDRLERKGYAERTPHPQDGRRILAAARSEAAFAAMAPLFAAWVRTLERLYDDYTDEELATIADFMHRAAALQREATEDLPAAEP
jgi:DNA-binding MarR family transcriptional regulator